MLMMASLITFIQRCVAMTPSSRVLSSQSLSTKAAKLVYQILPFLKALLTPLPPSPKNLHQCLHEQGQIASYSEGRLISLNQGSRIFFFSL